MQFLLLLILITIRAQIPAVKEPAGLLGSNGKCPEEQLLIAWTKGKLMAWDVTVPDTFAESHLSSTAAKQGAEAKQAADNKTAKYQGLEKTHLFPSCHRDSGIMEPASHGTGVKNQ